MIVPMTQAKFCDVHNAPNTLIRQEQAGRIHLTKYNTQIRRNLHLFLDACHPDIVAKLLEPAKTNGVDVENSWKVEVLIAPQTPVYNTGKKWRKTYMSVDEFVQFQKDTNAGQDVEEEEPEPTKVAPKKK